MCPQPCTPPCSLYWYCTKDARGASDGCCKYYDGRIGTSIANSNITYTDGSTQTFAAYAETAGAKGVMLTNTFVGKQQTGGAAG